MNGHFHQQFQLHSYKSEQIKYKHMLKKPWSPSVFTCRPFPAGTCSISMPSVQTYICVYIYFHLRHIKPSALHNIVAVLHYIFNTHDALNIITTSGC